MKANRKEFNGVWWLFWPQRQFQFGSCKCSSYTLPNSREYTNKRLTYLRSASAGICYNLSINWDIFQFNYHTRLIREQHERYKIFHFQSINWIENWLHHLTCHVPSSGVLNISQSVRYDVILWMNNEKHSMETLKHWFNVVMFLPT